jgi:hypothetical protein
LARRFLIIRKGLVGGMVGFEDCILFSFLSPR